MMAPVKIPSREGRCEKIEGAPGTCPPSNEGGLQGGHWKSAPSLDSTVDTPLKSPLGQGGTSPSTTSFCKHSRILSHLQGKEDFSLQGWVLPVCNHPHTPEKKLVSVRETA